MFLRFKAKSRSDEKKSITFRKFETILVCDFAASSADSPVQQRTRHARVSFVPRAMILLMLQDECLCSDREPSSPEAFACLSLLYYGRETSVSTECASSRRAARRAERTQFGRNWRSGFSFPVDASCLGVVLGDAVDVAPELGVARLQPGPVQAIALLDSSLNLLVVAETLVSAACVFVRERVSDRRRELRLTEFEVFRWYGETRRWGIRTSDGKLLLELIVDLAALLAARTHAAGHARGNLGEALGATRLRMMQPARHRASGERGDREGHLFRLSRTAGAVANARACVRRLGSGRRGGERWERRREFTVRVK